MLSKPKLLSATVGFVLLSFSYACNSEDQGPSIPIANPISKMEAPASIKTDDLAAVPVPVVREVPKSEVPEVVADPTPAPVLPTAPQFGNLVASPYYGVGLTGRVKALLGANMNSTALSASQDGVYIYGCVQTAAKLWKSAGILVEAGRFHGIELDFTGENCTNYDSSLEDSTSISFIDLKNAFKSEGIVVSKNLKAITFTLPNGTPFVLTKLDIVLPALD